MPIGSISGGDGGGKYDSSPDSLLLFPRRQLYDIDDKFFAGFNGVCDFKVIFVDNGAFVEINPWDQGISIEMEKSSRTTTGDYNVEFRDPVEKSTPYAFHRVGEHRVIVTFRERTADYNLEVRSPNNGNGIGGDGGIGINWLD